MKVHLFRVSSQPVNERLDTVLAAAAAMPIHERLRLIGQREMRLEAALAPHTRGNPSSYWLADFTTLRFEHGPGKASRTAPIAGFPLGADEGFGEETAVLYDPDTLHMLVQYNHHGPRAGSIQEYLSCVTQDTARSFEFQLRMDEQAEVRLAQRQVIKKIHFKIAPPRMSAGMRHAGVSIERALELSQDLGGQSIEVVISAGRGQLANGRANQMLAALRRVLDLDLVDGHGAVETLKVHARADVDDETEVINLLMPKIEQEIGELQMGADRRYTRRSRWDGLLRARNGWTDII